VSDTSQFDTVVHQLLNAANPEEAASLVRDFPWLISPEVYDELTGRIAHNRRRRDLPRMMGLMTGRGFLSRCRVAQNLDKVLADQPGWPLYDQGPLNRLLALPEAAPADERIHWANLASGDVDLKEEPDFRGLVDFHLGWGFYDKAEDGSDEARDLAIAHFENAEEAWQWADSLFGPRFKGLVQEYLGRLYLDRRHRDRIQDTETALSWFQKAYETFGEDTPPKRLALSMLLAKTYLSRIKGERLRNIEESIYYYHQAHTLAQQLEEEERLGDIEHSLAFAYRLRMEGDSEDNYEQAMAWAGRALERFCRHESPEEWARTTGELATLYAHRQRGDRAANIERAIDYAYQALEVYRPDTHVRQWLLVQLTLGNMYCDRIRGTRAENDKRAINCFRNVLGHCDPESEPLRWTEAMNNLGTVYASHSTRLNDANYRAAIDCFRRTLEVRSPETMPAKTLQTATNWGNLDFWFGAWPQARAAYDTAVRAAENLYRASFSPQGKQAELAENTTLYQRLLQVCLEEPDHRAALVAAEGGKARTFLDQMGQAAFPPPANLPSEQVEAEAELIESLRGGEQALSVLSGGGLLLGERSEEPSSAARDLLSQREEQLNALDAVWEEMARDPAAREYVAMRRGEPLAWRDMETLARRLGPNAALVEFYTLANEIVVFILRAGWDAPCVHRAPIRARQLANYVDRFTDEVVEFLSYEGDDQTWQGLANLLMADVLPHLKDVELVYFVPHGPLHYLPLHALEVNGNPLIKRLPARFAYAPSAAVLGRVLEQEKTRVRNGPGSALVVGDPMAPGDPPLANAEAEAEIVAEHFDDTVLYLGARATKARVLAEIGRHRYVHLACHGVYSASDPLQSGLKLHDGVLTAQEILELRLSADLVVLSACATGRQQVGRGDELMGLLRVLLYAGASSLVASLWSADDRSSLDLMKHFYQALDGQDPPSSPDRAEMLHAAMLKVRHEQGWEHPYFWAPFILVGAR